MSIELNLHWANLNKKNAKENKKLDKIENQIKFSLELHHNKMMRMFNINRTQVIPKKKKLLEKCKNEKERLELQSEINALEKEENDYYLKAIIYVMKYDEEKQDQDSKSYKESEEALSRISKDYFDSLDIHTPSKAEYIDIYTCEACGSEMFEYDISLFSCEQCGNSKTHIGSNSCSYKETIEHEYVYDFSYKRITHFQEWLNNVQAKENTNIPEEIINKIILELKKERVSDLSTLKIADIRKYLKILKFNKYYEHSSIILNRINKIPPLMINTELEKQLRIMFEKIQEPFEKYKPKDRKNFLSYAYVLRKFFELMDRKEFLIYFPLLKSREKVFAHDYVWKDICADLGWNYIPSI